MADRLADLVRRDLARFRAQAERNLHDAAELFEKELKQTVGVQGSRGVHSKKGQAPYRQDGDLLKSAFAFVDTRKMTVVAGFTARHWDYLYKTRPAIQITEKRTGLKVEEILLDRGYKEALNG